MQKVQKKKQRKHKQEEFCDSVAYAQLACFVSK